MSFLFEDFREGHLSSYFQKRKEGFHLFSQDEIPLCYISAFDKLRSKAPTWNLKLETLN